jgi:hypothetical protein
LRPGGFSLEKSRILAAYSLPSLPEIALHLIERLQEKEVLMRSKRTIPLSPLLHQAHPVWVIEDRQHPRIM